MRMRWKPFSEIKRTKDEERKDRNRRRNVRKWLRRHATRRAAFVVLLLILPLLACEDSSPLGLKVYPGTVLCPPCTGDGPLVEIQLPFALGTFATADKPGLCVDRSPFTICWYDCPAGTGSLEGDEVCTRKGF